MVNSNKPKNIIVVFIIVGIIMLFSGIGNAINHNWWKMALFYSIFIYLLFFLSIIILNFRIESYFKQLEAVILDNNRK